MHHHPYLLPAGVWAFHRLLEICLNLFVDCARIHLKRYVFTIDPLRINITIYFAFRPAHSTCTAFQRLCTSILCAHLPCIAYAESGLIVRQNGRQSNTAMINLYLKRVDFMVLLVAQLDKFGRHGNCLSTGLSHNNRALRIANTTNIDKRPMRASAANKSHTHTHTHAASSSHRQRPEKFMNRAQRFC